MEIASGWRTDVTKYAALLCVYVDHSYRGAGMQLSGLVTWFGAIDVYFRRIRSDNHFGHKPCWAGTRLGGYVPAWHWYALI